MSVVEFVGIPGCGKSTLYQALMSLENKPDTLKSDLDLYRFLVDKTYPLHKKVWNQLTGKRLSDEKIMSLVISNQLPDHLIQEFKTARPVQCQTVMSLLTDTYPDEADFKRMEKLVLQTFSLGHFAHQYLPSDNVFFMDEGYCQRGISVLLSPERKVLSKALEFYLSALPKTSISAVIDVRLDTDIALERALNREKGLPQRLQAASRDEVFQFVTQAREVLDKAINVVTLEGAKVLALDGLRSVEENVAETVMFLNKLKS